MKNILFISYALPPYLYPQSIQIGRFFKYLKSRYRMTVVCAQEDRSPDTSLYPDLFTGLAENRILRVPASAAGLGTKIGSRILPYFFKTPDAYERWAQRAYAECVKAYPKEAFDAVVTFSFPLSLNLLGQKLKNYYGCKWISHQSDPWADNPFMRFGPITRARNQRMETACFSAADRLIFTCQEAENFYRRKYPQWAEKISHIDHSYDPDLFSGSVSSPGLTKTIRYIGGFYGDRTIKPLLTVLRNLPVDIAENLQFEIIGANLKTRLQIQQAELPAKLVSFRERVGYAESLRLMEQSDALLVIDAPLESENIFFPSKLADYVGSGRPILGISRPGPTQRILTELGYLCFDHEDVPSLVKAFTDIKSGEYPLGGDGTQRYQASQNAERLAEVIDGL